MSSNPLEITYHDNSVWRPELPFLIDVSSWLSSSRAAFIIQGTGIINVCSFHITGVPFETFFYVNNAILFVPVGTLLYSLFCLEQLLQYYFFRNNINFYVISWRFSFISSAYSNKSPYNLKHIFVILFYNCQKVGTQHKPN